MLASGSGGNALVVSSARCRALVDAGLPPSVLERRLSAASLPADLTTLSGVCLTHEHGDHAAHAGALADLGVPVLATRGTLRAAKLPETRVLRSGLDHRMGEDLWVTAVALPHDAAEPAGFLFSDGQARLGVVLDCGRPDRRVAQSFRGLGALVLECNHDPAMLDAGTYPRWLKRRVAGPLGHFSNAQAAAFLELIGPPWPQVIVLAHLSANNNRPELALDAIRAVVGPEVELVVAQQARPLPAVEVTAGTAVFRAPPQPVQLDLFAPVEPNVA